MKLVLFILNSLNFISSMASQKSGSPELVAELLNKKSQSQVESEFQLNSIYNCIIINNNK